MRLAGVEPADLGGVDACLGGHVDVVDHLLRGPRFDAHRAHRNPATDLVDTDLEHPSGLVVGEGEALAAATLAQVHADPGVGHAIEVARAACRVNRPGRTG